MDDREYLRKNWDKVPKQWKHPVIREMIGLEPDNKTKAVHEQSQQTPKKYLQIKEGMKFMIQTEEGKQRYFIEIKEKEYEDLMGLYIRKS